MENKQEEAKNAWENEIGNYGHFAFRDFQSRLLEEIEKKVKDRSWDVSLESTDDLEWFKELILTIKP